MQKSKNSFANAYEEPNDTGPEGGELYLHDYPASDNGTVIWKSRKKFCRRRRGGAENCLAPPNGHEAGANPTSEPDRSPAMLPITPSCLCGGEVGHVAQHPFASS